MENDKHVGILSQVIRLEKMDVEKERKELGGVTTVEFWGLTWLLKFFHGSLGSILDQNHKYLLSNNAISV